MIKEKLSMIHSELLPSFTNETDLGAYEVEVEHIGFIADGSLLEGGLGPTRKCGSQHFLEFASKNRTH